MAAKKPISGAAGFAEIDPAADTLDAKVQVSATSRMLGRTTAGAGAHEELTASQVLTLLGLTPRAETPSGTVNGVNTTFTLANTPVAALGVIVLLDGIPQYNGSDYSVSGTTITFTAAPASGSTIFAYYNSVSTTAGGDFSSNTSSSADGEVVLFSGTDGKTGKRATGTGYPKLTSGVLSVLTADQLRADMGGNVISPAQITADQDNYAPTGFSDAIIIRLSGDSGFRAITGLSATSIFDGEEKTVVNVGSYPLYFPGEHPDSTAANRFDLPKDFMLFPKQSIKITYDSTASRWRITGEQAQDTIGRVLYYAASMASTTAGDHSVLGFSAIGTGTVTQSAAASGYPGFFSLSTVTSATSGYSLYFTKNSTPYAYYSKAHIWADFLLSIPTLSDGTNTFTIAAQITASVSGTSETGNSTVGIRYGSAVNSGKFQGYSRDNAAAESTVDLGVTVTATQLYRLRVEIDKSKTEIRFYVDGAMLGLVTANMPANGSCGARVVILKTAGTTARTLQVHAMSSAAIYT